VPIRWINWQARWLMASWAVIPLDDGAGSRAWLML